jgi:uncharacterized repeat protein (TIGR01451 family)
MVDLRYTFPAGMTPTNSANFVNGVWTGNMTVSELGTNFTIMADDRDGHVGFANRFVVLQTNDLMLFVSLSPSAPLVGSNLTYSILVLNAGPPTATGIRLTNTLPADVTFVSVTPSQGTCTNQNGIVTCDLDALGNLSGATVTLVVAPTVTGQVLTNSVTVVRNESESNLANNESVSIVTASLASSLLLQEAADYSGSAWRTGGPEMWTNQVTATHDGIDAGQSGLIIHGQESWIETTIRGPGTLSFWWKVSSQTNADILYFLARPITNPVFAVQTTITGEVGWQQRIYSVSAGQWVLRWRYFKDGSISSGTDAGWLDQFTYTVPAFSLSSPAYTNGQFYLTLNGTNGQRLIMQGSSEFIRWSPFSTNTLTGPLLNLTNNPPPNATWHFYRALHRND